MKVRKKDVRGKHVKYVFSKDGENRDEWYELENTNDERMPHISVEEIRHRARNSIYERSENFQLIDELVTSLAENPKYLIPQFLLRAQLIEFALKFLYLEFPHIKLSGIDEQHVERMTMGQVIKALEELNDGHLDEIVYAAHEFKDLRNKITHRLVTLNDTRAEIEKEITANLEVAEELENRIIFFLEFIYQY